MLINGRRNLPVVLTTIPQCTTAKINMGTIVAEILPVHGRLRSWVRKHGAGVSGKYGRGHRGRTGHGEGEIGTDESPGHIWLIGGPSGPAGAWEWREIRLGVPIQRERRVGRDEPAVCCEGDGFLGGHEGSVELRAVLPRVHDDGGRARRAGREVVRVPDGGDGAGGRAEVVYGTGGGHGHG